MSRKTNWKKPVKRASVLTITAIFMIAIFIPAVMGGMSAWNDWIADHNGRAFHVRTAANIIDVDPENASLNGDIIGYRENESAEVDFVMQSIIWGNSTNIGYHSFIFEDSDMDEIDPSVFSFAIRLNCSTVNLRDNNTVSFSMDLAGFNGTDVTVSAYACSSLTDWISADIYLLDTCAADTVNDSSTITFTTFVMEFSYLDIITAEDSVGVNNYIYISVESDSGSLEDGAECFFRIYDSSLNNFGTINTAAGYTFTLFMIGMFLVFSAMLASPMVQFVGPGIRKQARSGYSKAKSGYSKARSRSKSRTYTRGRR
jgi:hypothetical protein